MGLKKPKILFYDIETKPVKAWVWRTGKQYINHSQIVDGERFDIICLAYKWYGERQVRTLDWGIKKQCSKSMIKAFGKIIEEADIAIGQNSDRFDVKQINTQRLMHNLPPIAWPTSEDMLKLMRKQFYLTSFSLDYVSKLLTGDGKDRMSFADWIDIVDYKDTKALDKMLKYCAKDVKKLESVFRKIEPHLDYKAHRGVISGAGRDSCPGCGTTNIQNYGKVIRRTGKYQRYRCTECGKVWRDTRLFRG